MKKYCRCLDKLQQNGFVDNECFVKCDSYIEEKELMDIEESKKLNDSFKVQSSDHELKLEALKKIEESYPDNYQDRTDYKIIKHNLE